MLRTLTFVRISLSLIGITLLFVSAMIVVVNLQSMFSPTTFMAVVILGSVGYATYIAHNIVSVVTFLVREHEEKIASKD